MLIIVHESIYTMKRYIGGQNTDVSWLSYNLLLLVAVYN